MIVLLGEKRVDTDFLEGRFEMIQFCLNVGNNGRIVFFISHLDQFQNITILIQQSVHGIYSILQVFGFLHLFVGNLRVVPEIWRLHFHFQLFNSFFFIFQIQRGRDLLQRDLIRLDF